MKSLALKVVTAVPSCSCGKCSRKLFKAMSSSLTCQFKVTMKHTSQTNVFQNETGQSVKEIQSVIGWCFVTYNQITNVQQRQNQYTFMEEYNDNAHHDSCTVRAASDKICVCVQKMVYRRIFGCHVYMEDTTAECKTVFCVNGSLRCVHTNFVLRLNGRI